MNQVIEALLFLVIGLAGVVLAIVTRRQQRAAQAQRPVDPDVERLRRERDELAGTVEALRRCLEQDVHGVGDLLLASIQAERAGPREVYETGLALIEAQCGAAASILIHLPGGRLELVAHRGWPESERAQRLRDARYSDFVDRALSSGQDVNGFSLGENPPDRGPRLVSPLIDDEGIVRAMLCLDEIPAERVNGTSLRNFLAIGEWMSAVLSRIARDVPSATKRSPAADLLTPTAMWIGSHEDLGHAVRLEYERATRQGLALSVLAVQFPEWDELSARGQTRLDRYAMRHLTSTLRASDAVFRFGFPGCYVVVLAGTPAEGAEVVRLRLLRRLQHSPLEPVGRAEMWVTGPDAGAPDPPSLLNRLVPYFREQSVLSLGQRCPVVLPVRTPVGTLDQCARRLRRETSLAEREDHPLCVIGLAAVGEPDVEPGLVALHVEEIAPEVLRDTDAGYAIGPSHVAIVLPHTTRSEARNVADRLVEVLAERRPEAPYGRLAAQVLTFNREHPDAESFLDVLSRSAPLSDVRVSGALI